MALVTTNNTNALVADDFAIYSRYLAKHSVFLQLGNFERSIQELKNLEVFLLSKNLHKQCSEISLKIAQLYYQIINYQQFRNYLIRAYDLFQGNPDPESALVEQNEYAISQVWPLGTSSIGECMALAVCHEESQTIGLAHIDRLTTQESIVEFLSKMPKGALKAHLIGGTALDSHMSAVSQQNLEKVEAALRARDRLEICRAVIELNHPTAFVIRPNGKIDSDTVPMRFCENRLARSGLAEFASKPRPLRKAYTHTTDTQFTESPLEFSDDIMDNLKPYRNLSENKIIALHTVDGISTKTLVAFMALALIGFLSQ